MVHTYLIEMPLCLLFFAPTKELKVFTFKAQNLLMVTIMLTGNYNFFNFLYMALCLSLMDDSWINGDETIGNFCHENRLKLSLHIL